MLVVSRRVGETVMIGADVAITVLRVTGKQVRVGIAAPRNIGVYRKEIYRPPQHELNLQEADDIDCHDS